jgi:hypothetical protein
MKLNFIKFLYVFNLAFFFAAYSIDPNDLFIEELENADFLENVQWDLSRNKQDIINILLDLGIVDLLKEPFYLRTNPLNMRSLLDMPFAEDMELYVPCIIRPGQIHHIRRLGFHLFYNQTTRSVFVDDCTNISSYIGFQKDSFIEKTVDVFEKIKILKPEFDLDPRVLLNLFSNLTVQDRRAGIMLTGLFELPVPRPMLLRITTPFYYHERNYYLTDKEAKRISEELSTPDQPESSRELEDCHLISDRLGMGDTRIVLTTPFYECPQVKIGGGPYMTIPTAISFAKGVIRGTTYCPRFTRPQFNLALLQDDEALANNTAEDQLINFALGALDQLSANLLNTQLGSGHAGIGLEVHIKTPLTTMISRPWARKFKMKSRYSIEYVLPASEVRYFINCSDKGEFNRRNFNDESQSDSNFAFLETTLTNRLYPFAQYVRVSPSPIFRSTSRFIYDTPRIRWTIASDTWIQLREHLNVDRCSFI